MKKGKPWLWALIVILLAGYFIFDPGQYLSLGHFKSQQLAIQHYQADHPWQLAGLYFVAYVMVTALSIPGATLMTLAGGAIFGLWWGVLIISFASTFGATLAFLLARFLLRDYVQARFGDRLKPINDGMAKDGAFYLFTLRLVPYFPFFMINLAMGLTPIRTWTFYWVSQVGMLAGTLVYVNAGTQLGRIDSLSGILSPGLAAAFILLGIFPLLAKKLIGHLTARRLYAAYAKPDHFDRNLIVIGGGSAGLVCAYLGAALKARVTLIEKHRLGGDCLNTGCVPSKALLRSARFMQQIRRAAEFGMKTATADFTFADVMQRVQRVIKRIEPHDSAERYASLGVEVIQGAARITSPYGVAVNGRQLTTRNIVIATGASPVVPDISGLADVGYLTSETVWELREQPKRLLVLGGGPIGCELAQGFARLGSQVTLVQRGPRLLPREDAEVSDRVKAYFEHEGITVHTGYSPSSFRAQDGRKVMVCEHEGSSHEIEFDQLLLALGRRANTHGFGLEELGIATTATGTIAVNEYLQTRFPNIYACGDVAGPFQFTHTAAHQAWYCAVNALFGRFRKFKVDYTVIPWATFTDPEVARVGLNEQEAIEKGIAYEVTRFDLDELDRAITDEAAHGFIKVLTAPGRDKILGATIVGEHAGELIAEYVMAMKHGLGLNKILGTIHIYPTLAEANRYAAGAWRRAHAPQHLLRWAERFHGWMRGSVSQ